MSSHARAPGHLVVTSGPDDGTRIELAQRITVIGRDDAADVRVRGEGVSRHHAKLVVDADGGVQIVDLGAKNGTWVNGRAIKAAQLEPGDAIQIGRVTLRFERGDGACPTESLELTPRELEIGRLVARGLTNAEVGEVLGISRATVSTHLQRAYKRLGLASRAELARLVADHDHDR